MKMTIDKSIEFYNGLECYTPQAKAARDVAIETMRKYQNLQNKLDQLELEMELTLESDTRRMFNRESENGWLFDRIIRWKKALEEIEGEVEYGKNKYVWEVPLQWLFE